MKLDRKLIIAKLIQTGKFGTVRFRKANDAHGTDKWSVYLRPKSDRYGVHFHVSHVDGGFVSQDEYSLPHKSYYTYGLQSTPRLEPTETPLGAIREVACLLNNGYRVVKL